MLAEEKARVKIDKQLRNEKAAVLLDEFGIH